MIPVSSRANDHFKRLSSLTTAKAMKKHGEFLVMGEKLVRETLKDPRGFKIRSEIVPPGGTSITSKGITVFEFSGELFREVDTLGTKFNLLVLQLPELRESDLSAEPLGLELVCPLGDPSNLGAVIRSAAAFGISKIILTEEAASPFHPKAIKASAGAVLGIAIERTGALASYRATGASYALDMKGMPIENWEAPANARLIVGEEGPGLPELKSIPRISIPTVSVESLNATVAASLAIAEWRRRRT